MPFNIFICHKLTICNVFCLENSNILRINSLYLETMKIKFKFKFKVNRNK